MVDGCISGFLIVDKSKFKTRPVNIIDHDINNIYLPYHYYYQ